MGTKNEQKTNFVDSYIQHDIWDVQTYASDFSILLVDEVVSTERGHD